jgi:hypothetical protein
MKTEMLTDETIVKKGVANLQRGAETVGGKLFLTNQRIVFESHSFNIQNGATVIPLAEVGETEFRWTKFLNLIPVAPNSLAVFTNEGIEHRFVLFGRAAWREAIKKQQAAG